MFLFGFLTVASWNKTCFTFYCSYTFDVDSNCTFSITCAFFLPQMLGLPSACSTSTPSTRRSATTTEKIGKPSQKYFAPDRPVVVPSPRKHHAPVHNFRPPQGPRSDCCAWAFLVPSVQVQRQGGTWASVLVWYLNELALISGLRVCAFSLSLRISKDVVLKHSQAVLHHRRPRRCRREGKSVEELPPPARASSVASECIRTKTVLSYASWHRSCNANTTPYISIAAV